MDNPSSTSRTSNLRKSWPAIALVLAGTALCYTLTVLLAPPPLPPPDMSEAVPASPAPDKSERSESISESLGRTADKMEEASTNIQRACKEVEELTKSLKETRRLVEETRKAVQETTKNVEDATKRTSDLNKRLDPHSPPSP